MQISRLGDLNAPSRGLVGLLWALGHGVINPVLDGLARDFGVAANVCLCRGAKVGLLLVKHVPTDVNGGAQIPQNYMSRDLTHWVELVLLSAMVTDGDVDSSSGVER